MTSHDELLNILVAYPYFKAQANILGEHSSRIRLLIDSGAFTAFKAKRTITVDEYCNFIEKMPIKPWAYFTLDVIGQPDATRRNYDLMLERGFSPIPIFTRGTDIAHLNHYYSTSNVVGIGGLVGTAKNRGFVNGIMDHIAGRKTHLLGFVDLQFLRFYKPFSCDSSGWSNSIYGRLTLYMGHGKVVHMKRDQFARPLSADVQQRLAMYGVDAPALARESSWRGEALRGGKRYEECPRHLVTVRSMVHFASDVETKLGTKYFFSCVAGASDPLPLINAWERMRR